MPGKKDCQPQIAEAYQRILNEAEAAGGGYKLTVQPAWSLGRLCAAGFRRDGMIRAAATPRFLQAYPVGR